jgi:membrane protease YdiL (CAAX protease family)
VNPAADSHPGPWLRLLRFPPARLALLYAVLSYLYLSGFFFRMSYAKGPWKGVAATVMAGAMMLVLYAVIVRVVERRSVSELALPAMGRELGVGALLGAGLYASCMGILALLGNYRVEGLNDWHVLVAGLAVALATGVYEELVFRGGVFRLLEDWLGSWAALVLSSLVFGLVHLDNEAGSLQGVVSISLWAGILLSGSYLLTRRLWLGIGLHAAWNYTQGTVFSTIVSGNAPPAGFLKSRLEGSHWLTGGSFGVEASLVAAVVGSTAGMVMLVMAVRRGHIVPPSWQRKP